MSAEVWSSEGEPPQKRSGIPGWVWFCGGGCLLVLLCLVVLLVFSVRMVKQGLDPERQWAELARVIAVDESPEHLRMRFGMSLMWDFYFLEDVRGYTLVLYVVDRSKAADVDQLFTPKFEESGGAFGMSGIRDAELGTIELQGRSLPIQRFFQSGGASGMGAPGQPEIGSGHSAFVDISPPDSERVLLAFLVRVRSGDTPLTDEEVRDVLAPFHIGPVHRAPAPAGEGAPAPAEER